MVEFENMEQREVLETPNLEESPNETLDRKLRAYFDGKIVRKDLTKSIKEGANVPVYVLEFLLGQYCSSDDQSVIDEGIHNVKKILADNFVRPDEAQKILSMLRASYAKKEAQYGAPVMRELERVMTLRVVDEYWMDHIDAMDDLRQGIRLRAYAQTDPVIEYKREGFEMFEAMTNAIKEEIVRRVFLVRLRTNEEVKRERVAKITGEGGGGDKTVKRQPVVKKIKVGPNDPCPCGSGKKYKKCCRDKDLAAEQGKQA